MSDPTRIKAVLFDKDGTLFDFRATWDVWTHQVLVDLAKGREDVLKAMAHDARFDLDTRKMQSDSPIIAGTQAEATSILLRHLPEWTFDTLIRHLDDLVAVAPLVPAAPLPQLLGQLQNMGIATGVMTNDSEAGALAHLKAAGVHEMFDFVAGYDSGYGAKPDPDPLLAFAQQIGCAPEQTAMIGDSRHDLMAARAAGMVSVGVLTGVAGTDELSDLADVILGHIGHVPDWLQSGPNE